MCSLKELIGATPAVVAGIAAVMGESTQTVYNWLRRGVPVERMAEFERATGGRARRWVMRPFDWDTIWPELVGAPGAPVPPRPEQVAA